MYALLVERLERHVLAERHVAAVMLAAGSKKARVPTFENELHRLDRVLEAVPGRQYGEEQAALIAALGLGGG